MAWIARNKKSNGLVIFAVTPVWDEKWECWNYPNDEIEIDLPTDANEKLIDRHLTWEDGPIEI